MREHANWTLEDIPYDRIHTDLVKDDETLFGLLASASFVEITTGLYTDNLLTLCEGRPEMGRWLDEHWRHEEIQHGEALKHYVLAVWPEFDWERAYRAFYEEYSAVCTLDEFEPTPGLEMLARSVIEVGTSTLYFMMTKYAVEEPVLKKLANHIKQDEVRHYTYFLHYFRQLNESEQNGRGRVARAILKRVGEIEDEDSRIAIRHVRSGLPEGHRFKGVDYDRIKRQFVPVVREHFPYEMAVKMCLRPLDLNQGVRRVLTPVLNKTLQYAMFR